MTDLVSRLRNYSLHITAEAADRIEADAKRIQTLERALMRLYDRVKIDAQMSGPVVVGLNRGVWAGRTIHQDWSDAQAALAALANHRSTPR